jgi:hypothetical protein
MPAMIDLGAAIEIDDPKLRRGKLTLIYSTAVLVLASMTDRQSVKL